MRYRAVFRCVAGCPGEFPLDQPIYRCPACGDLLEVVHDLDALQQVRPGGLDAPVRRPLQAHDLALRLGGVGQEGMGVPRTSATRTSCRWTRAAPTCSGPSASAARSGLDDLWVKMCGNSHTGSFKDLGMTVLVSVVQQMIADGQTDPRGRLRLDRRHVGVARGLRRGGRHSRDRDPAARQGLDRRSCVQPLANGALVLSLDTDFDGCMAIVQRLAAEEGVYLANSMNSLRVEGQKTVAIEIVAAVRLGGARLVIIPGGNLGNVSALGAGFDMMEALGLITQAAAHRRGAGGGGQSALPRLHGRLGLRADHRAARRSPPRSRSATRSRSRRPSATLKQLRRHRRAGDRGGAGGRGGARRSHRHVQLPAHRRRARRARSSSSSAAQIGPRERVVVISTANGLKFTDFKIAYHEARSPASQPRAREPPGRAAERLRRRAARDRRSARNPVLDFGTIGPGRHASDGNWPSLILVLDLRAESERSEASRGAFVR